jgi:hypothetical protein
MNPAVKYFSLERAWCTAGVAIAAISILIALWFFFRVKQPFQTGMAYPFMLLGIVFFVICLSVALRSSGDLARVTNMIQQDRPALASVEIPRMNTVMRNFTVILVLEVTFLLVSGSLLLWVDLSPSWKGAMTGLLLQAAWLFIFDLFAHSRGKEYAAYLESLLSSR